MLQGRFVVLTGGSSGIGRALAAELAARGASVLVGSRRKIEDDLQHHTLDLASLSSVSEFAANIVALGRPIDVLVLNAGVHVPWRRVTTRDGHELHWQVNYLSNFLLTHLLLDGCRRSALKQIVYVGSEAHRLAAIAAGPLSGFWHHYAVSKEAATRFFLRLQEVHPDLRVQIISPGYVATGIHRHKSRITAWLERASSRVRTPEDSAREIIRVIELPEAMSVYWDRGNAATPSRRARNLAGAEALWRESVASVRHILPDAVPCVRITNFARTWRAFGPEASQPANVEELAALVRRAADAGRQVRIVGQRHSYNDSFYSRTAMISIARLNRIRGLDPDAGTFTCEAGITIDEVCAHLDERGYGLRYCGNHGQQTLAGALATGTHGYGRDGGLMSELVMAVTLLGPDGRLLHTSAERDLRALRLGLGTLGVVVEVSLAVKRCSPCVYRLASMPRREFIARLDELARSHEYLRYIPHPFDDAAMLYLTIDATTEQYLSTQPVRYTGPPAGGAAWLAVPWLRMPAVRRVLGRAASVGRREFSVVVPFSTSLFIRDGVIHRNSPSQEMLRRIGLRAFNRNDWLNMELAVPRDRFPEFAQLFEENLPRMSAFSTAQPYYACRVVGAAQSVLLGPNFGRDVVFVDIHVDPRARSSDGFLRAVEAESLRALAARPHWGKVFFAEHDTLRTLYPSSNFTDFADAKQRFDPESVFSNAYTRRVLGV
jgi:FAD/FMN-containing dehydrogenase/NAD(P)-dependent dehydrogenase (short-subunit alcohol dehydrogenase family)